VVQIKEHIEKFGKSKKPWVRVVRTILIIVASLFLIGLFLSQQPEKEEVEVETLKYEVRVGNSIGHHTYYCESYVLVESTYKLFDEDSTLTNEITITDGYLVEINLSE